MRFVIYYGTQGFEIGRAEHNWEFTEDGHYRLRGMTRTSGLAALIKPLVFENESSGRLVAGGLLLSLALLWVQRRHAAPRA